MINLVLVTVFTAFALSAIFVPFVRTLFRQLGLVDKPDKERKLHSNAISLGGGLAVFSAVAAAFAIVLTMDRYLGDSTLGYLRGNWYLLFGAAAALMVVGLLDDVFTLRGRQKLLLQILIVVSLVGSGTLVESIELFGTRFSLGVFAYPLTVLWLLAAINALNLIDGADGMASTVGAIISGGLAVLCVQTGAPLGAIVGAALAGALLGFLIYNRPPASIYLGDAGSMVIGLFIGVIAIWGSVKESTMLSVAPLLMLTIPLFDSVVALLRRVLTGRSIYATDRGHLHHRLLDRFSHRVMLVVVASLCTITTVGAILSMHFDNQWIAVASVALVVGALVLTRSFGNAELRMLAARTSHIGEALLMRSQLCDSRFHQRSVQLQGNRCWEAIWTSLVEFAGDRGLVQIKLDVGIAWMHEGYHGAWQRARMPEKPDQASIRLPIYVDDRLVGRLEATCDGRKSDFGDTMLLLVDRGQELSDQIRRLMETDGRKGLAMPPATAAAQTPESVPSGGTLNDVEVSRHPTGAHATQMDFQFASHQD
jgi:UDP-GlcNAc:undecaprenyl-phosphate GlcNAc-1-phosphate transferase